MLRWMPQVLKRILHLKNMEKCDQFDCFKPMDQTRSQVQDRPEARSTKSTRCPSNSKMCLRGHKFLCKGQTKNIARGTTDPWVDTITRSTLQLANLVNRWRHMNLLEILALVQNLATRWHHLHWYKIWPPDGVTCIRRKFGHQAPLALVGNLTNR